MSFLAPCLIFPISNDLVFSFHLNFKLKKKVIKTIGKKCFEEKCKNHTHIINKKNLKNNNKNKR